MVRPHRARHLPSLLLAVAWMVSGYPCVFGQSSTPPDFLLKVVSAKYLPETARIEYKLANRGQNAVTAFALEVSVIVADKPATHTGEPFGESRDLLTVELFRQCRNVPENSAEEDASPWPDDMKLPHGVIQPGEVYVQTILGDGLLDKSMLSREV